MSYYAAEDLGRPCPTCGGRVPRAIQSNYHPTCHPTDRASFPELVAGLVLVLALVLVPLAVLIQGSSPA